MYLYIELLPSHLFERTEDSAWNLLSTVHIKNKSVLQRSICFLNIFYYFAYKRGLNIHILQ
jgi:hypothetical protein